uniref:Uncharacterized protein n=1 Tax=Pseudonaja textilis TaxID=8673 RepID=A0A670ZU14_PSETE
MAWHQQSFAPAPPRAPGRPGAPEPTPSPTGAPLAVPLAGSSGPAASAPALPATPSGGEESQVRGAKSGPGVVGQLQGGTVPVGGATLACAWQEAGAAFGYLQRDRASPLLGQLPLLSACQEEEEEQGRAWASCLARGLSSGVLGGSWCLAPEAAGVPSPFHPQLEERVSFDFAAWRKRYLQWIGHRKSRVLDIFHSIDRGHDGRLTQQEFIGRVLASKFPTSLPEMKAVAKIFDVNRDGFIDYYEFIRALHPSRDVLQRAANVDHIQEEVKRQVAECNCVKCFQVEQIGATRYRLGECQQLRMVRILRSTLMVRVGGGWTALDEFLVKNDPCRVKGRTNLKINERYLSPGLLGRKGTGSQSAPASKMLSPSCSTPSLCLYSSASAPSSPVPRKVSRLREERVGRGGHGVCSKRASGHWKRKFRQGNGRGKRGGKPGSSWRKSVCPQPRLSQEAQVGGSSLPGEMGEPLAKGEPLPPNAVRLGNLWPEVWEGAQESGAGREKPFQPLPPSSGWGGGRQRQRTGWKTAWPLRALET